MLHAAVVDVREVAVERSIARRGNGSLCLGCTMRACMDVARKSHISMPAGMAWRFKAMKTEDIPPTLRLLLSWAVGAGAFIGGIGPSWFAWNMRLWGVPAFCALGSCGSAIRLAMGGLALRRHQALD
ncbi:hypothetical protein [Comamonas jiangduensis]|uniref:hypothetical protein n=1 Tax=Comamonas jiangduensis TaxID=1194168 RepID=UPI0024E1752E|nr:hypothetical protein [Comamonas jiangduensis]